MALATTCPQCKTSFKVVPDQLKLRRGLVRCGVCQHVFSGIDFLRYVDDTGQAARPAGGSEASHHRAGAGRAQQAEARADDRQTSAADEDGAAADAAPGNARGDADSADGDSPGAGAVGAGAVGTGAVGAGAVGAGGEGRDEAGGRHDDERDVAHERDAHDGRNARDAGDLRQAGDTPDDPAALARERSRARRAARRERSARAEAPPVPPPPEADDDLKTRFFMADGEDGPFPRAGAGDLSPPRFIVDDAGGDDSPSSTLPTAAGEHVESLAEWIDERSEAAEASRARRARRRASRREAEGRGSAAASMVGGFAPEEAGGIPVRRAEDRAHGVRATRFPALPDGPDNDPQDFAAQGRGLFGDLLAGHGRRRLLIGLAVLAGLQLALCFRDGLASSIPLARPVLAVLGAPLGLRIEPLRRIDDLSIEGGEIQDLGRYNQYALTALIRNRSGKPLRWPAMELSLMDPSRNIVVRKVIEPGTYLGAFVRTDGIAPRSEQPIRLTIETRDVRMAGYTVALFYP